MLGTVYIETTIPSYYYETRRASGINTWREVTRKWWKDYRTEYDLFTSAYVLAELRRAPAQKARRAKELLADVAVLDEPPGFRDVVSYYIENRLMPGDALGDAAHLAVASMHGMKFLLTWNCRHLANANKAQHIAVLNARLGLPVPIVTTPMELIPEDF
jgi:predicted nucleic acid-binding protein